MYSQLLTPVPLIDLDRMEANIAAMQAICNDAGVELRPHIKTHKMVEVARRQLQAGAAGLTCAKIGEAEAILPAYDGAKGKREIFIAHSLVDNSAGPRLRKLQEALDEVAVGCTSERHAPVLEALAASAGIKLPVVMAVDTGLGREGARDKEGAVRLAELIARQPHLQLKAIYTHEGHFYSMEKDEVDGRMKQWNEYLVDVRDAVQKALGTPVLLWPGCSATAARAARLPGFDAVRPGAYVLGDLALTDTTGVMQPDEVALKVLTTVVDRPEADLALLDCGSKTLSTDRAASGYYAKSEYGPVVRVNEEHGYLTGEGANRLELGQRIPLIPAHICPVINLADRVAVTRGGEFVEFWNVEARGKVQ